MPTKCVSQPDVNDTIESVEEIYNFTLPNITRNATRNTEMKRLTTAKLNNHRFHMVQDDEKLEPAVFLDAWSRIRSHGQCYYSNENTNVQEMNSTLMEISTMKSVTETPFQLSITNVIDQRVKEVSNTIAVTKPMEHAMDQAMVQAMDQTVDQVMDQAMDQVIDQAIENAYASLTASLFLHIFNFSFL